MLNVVMPASILPTVKKTFLLPLFVLITLFLASFIAIMDEQDWQNWTNKFLIDRYDPSAEEKIKKWEIMLTPDHFIRVRKTYQQGKQEYYSFNLKRFTEINYLSGTGLTDTLQIQTQADDIIMQTYDDPKGNIDSMETMLKIPVKKIEPLRLDSLRQALNFLKAKSPL